MEAGYGQKPINPEALSFSSLCRQAPTIMIWLEPGRAIREPNGYSVLAVRHPRACSNNTPHHPSKLGTVQPRLGTRSQELLGCDVLQRLNVGEARLPSFQAFERRQPSRPSRAQMRMPRSLMAMGRLRRYSPAILRAFSWTRERADRRLRSKSG